MRPGEYVRCQETDLRPHTKSLQVPGTKTADSATVLSIDDRFWKWVCQGIPCPVTHATLADRWKKACATAGYHGVRLYDLRHCHGQWLSDEGVPEARIQTALRHKTAAMTRRYTTQQDKGESNRALANVMFGPSGPAVYPAPQSDSSAEMAG